MENEKQDETAEHISGRFRNYHVVFCVIRFDVLKSRDPTKELKRVKP